MTSFLPKLEKHWFIDDTPQLWKGVVDNPSQYATWKEVEYCLNNPQFFDMQFINKYTNTYVEYPIHERCWSKPSADVKDLMDIFSDGHSLVINNFEWVGNDKLKICEEVESFFPEIRASLHIYCGLDASRSFKIHEDYANNFILQVEGETHWKIYNNRASNMVGQVSYDIVEDDLDCAIDTILCPGDLLFIPARCYHYAQPKEKRLSVSIPMQHMLPHLKKVDRTYYEIP
jgi:hypothetical protein